MKALPKVRVAITGGRDYADQPMVDAVLREVLRIYGRFTLVSGAARGADTLGVRAARVVHCPVVLYPADWRGLGRTAGFVRNQAMVDSGLDLVIAFPGGNGTADMVGRSVRAGVPVVKFQASDW